MALNVPRQQPSVVFADLKKLLHSKGQIPVVIASVQAVAPFNSSASSTFELNFNVATPQKSPFSFLAQLFATELATVSFPQFSAMSIICCAKLDESH